MTGAPIKPERSDDVVGAVLVFRDETDRRSRQRQLANREQHFRSLTESMPQLVWMANSTGDIFWYNRRWYEYNCTTLVKNGAGSPSTILPICQGCSNAGATASRSGDPLDMVFPLKAANGSFRPFLTRVVAIRDDDHKIMQWFGTNTDISEQMRTEA